MALDEGVSVEHILMQCDKLKGGIFNNKEVWCIYNNDNSILKKGSKASPSDFGKENFELGLYFSLLYKTGVRGTAIREITTDNLYIKYDSKRIRHILH